MDCKYLVARKYRRSPASATRSRMKSSVLAAAIIAWARGSRAITSGITSTGVRVGIGALLLLPAASQATADCKVVTTPIATIAVPSQVETHVRALPGEDSFIWELMLGREGLTLEFGLGADVASTENLRKVRDPLAPSMILTVRRADHSNLDLDGLVQRGLLLGPSANEVVIADVQRVGSTWKATVFGPRGVRRTLESGTELTRYGGKLIIDSAALAYIDEYHQNGQGGWDSLRTRVPVVRGNALTERRMQESDRQCDWFVVRD